MFIVDGVGVTEKLLLNLRSKMYRNCSLSRRCDSKFNLNKGNGLEDRKS